MKITDDNQAKEVLKNLDIELFALWEYIKEHVPEKPTYKYLNAQICQTRLAMMSGILREMDYERFRVFHKNK